jgi:hypothetical protein
MDTQEGKVPVVDETTRTIGAMEVGGKIFRTRETQDAVPTTEMLTQGTEVRWYQSRFKAWLVTIPVIRPAASKLRGMST